MGRPRTEVLAALFDRLDAGLFVARIERPGDDASLVFIPANDRARRLQVPDGTVAPAVMRAIRDGEAASISSGWIIPRAPDEADVVIEPPTRGPADLHARLLDQIEQAVVMIDRQGRAAYCNAYLETMTGFAREDVLGQEVLKMVAPDSQARVRDIIETVLSGESWTGEVTARRSDGSFFPAFSTLSPVYQEDEIVGAVAVGTDVSPFGEAQETVRTFAARQQALLRAVPDRILTVRRDGTYVDFRAAAPLTGPLYRRSLTDVAPPEAVAMLRRAVQRALTRGAVETLEYEGADSASAFEARVAPIDSDEAVVVIRDVTERRRQQEMLDRAYTELEARVHQRTMELAHANAALLQEIAVREKTEAELRENNRRLQVIIEGSPTAIIELDTDLSVVSWNPAAERMFGWTAEEAIGRRHLTMPPGDLPRLQLLFDALLRGGSVNGMEVPRLTKDGRTIVVNVSGAPMRDGDGRIRGILFIVAETQPHHVALSGQIEELGRHLAVLDSLTLALSRSLHTDEIFAALQQGLADRLGIGSGAIYLPESDGESLRLQYGWGEATNGLARLRPRTTDTELARSAAASRSLVAVPLPSKQRAAGVLVVQRNDGEPFSREHVDLLRMIALEAAVALENARLFSEVREANERLQLLSRRLLAVQEEERKHIGRELHDQIGQMLTALKLMIESLAQPETSPRDVIGQAQTLIKELFDIIRGLSLELRPPMLDDGGLMAALLFHVEQYQQRTRIAVDLRCGELPRFDTEVETAAFRIIQEALTNVARHSRTSSVRVLVWLANDLLMMQIEDDGDGFDAQAALRAPGLGLSGMRERATLLGGRVTIDSAPERGTIVAVELPAQPRERPA